MRSTLHPVLGFAIAAAATVASAAAPAKDAKTQVNASARATATGGASIVKLRNAGLGEKPTAEASPDAGFVEVGIRLRGGGSPLHAVELAVVSTVP